MKKYDPNFLRSFIHIFLDLLFPRQCLGCGQERTWLCEDCLNNLPRSFCIADDKIFSVFDYQAPIVKKIIWRLKYKRNLELTEVLAPILHNVLIEELTDRLLLVDETINLSRKNIVLIPVPLTKRRRRFRGYNQAEELAKQIARLDSEQFDLNLTILKKIKDTPTQVSQKNREARLKNLKNSFSLTAENLAGKIVVIVDDVSTTGATINEIRHLLLSSLSPSKQPRYICALVIAHG